MKILVTGAKGFLGQNLVQTLKTFQDGRNKTRQLDIDEIYEYDRSSSYQDLIEYCTKADFIYHLAGVNRPKTQAEFMQGNFGFSSELLDILKKHNNHAAIVLSSSIQASLIGRYSSSDYGKSKLAGEELFLAYGKEMNIPVYVYRFFNLYGKWSRPNYNSVIATFCHNLANDLPIQINGNPKIRLSYVDDVVDELLNCLQGHPSRCEWDGVEALPQENGRYCYVPIFDDMYLKDIVDLLYQFKEQRKSLIMPPIPKDSFNKKLYSTYLSYLPKDKVVIQLCMHKDDRGSFTELLKSNQCGQFAVNISKPGVVKGQHWHHTKWEFFMVVSGHALIQERRITDNQLFEFEVNGDDLKAVHMLPGYTHNIINLSNNESLITLMWANELFDAEHPDTYFEKV